MGTIFGIPVEIIGNWVGLISGVFGILAFFPIVWATYYVVLGKGKMQREIFRQLREKPGRRPAILIVDLLPGKEISAAVERFRQNSNLLKDIPLNRIFQVERSKSMHADDMPKFAADLRKKSAELMSHGTDVLHLFYGGPGGAAMVVGAEFANSCRVILYQYEQGDYKNWGVLKHDYAL